MSKLTKFNLKNVKKALIILIISFIISFFLYLKIDNTSILLALQDLESLLLTNHFNLIIYHFLIISSLTLLVLFGLGFIIIPLYLTMEFTCLFYQILIFIKLASFKGLLFSLIYNFILKGLYLLLIIIFLKKLLNIFHLFIKSIINKITIDKNILIANLKALILIIFLIILNDLIIYFWGSKILLKFIYILQ